MKKEIKPNEIIRFGACYGQSTRWGMYSAEGICSTLVASMGEGGGFVPFVREEIDEETGHKSYS